MKESPRNSETLANMGLMLLGLAWLIPNHRMPWVSFWNEAIAFLGAACFSLNFLRKQENITIQIPFGMIICFSGICGSLILQKAINIIIFPIDLFIVFIYAFVFFFIFSIFQADGGSKLKEKTAWTFILFSICSVIIGLLQWLSFDAFAPFVVDLPPGSSIISNVAQRNHFSTICFIGICLLLQRKDTLSKAPYYLIFTFLAWGIAMAQSRTAIAQALGLAVFGSIVDKNRRQDYVIVLMVTALFFAIFKQANELLLINGNREISNLINTQGRLEIWNAMWVAFLEKPWLGYGWLQTASAHLDVAEKVPRGSDLNIIEYSHNIILDFLIWIGLPGSIIVATTFAASLIKIYLHSGKIEQTPIFFAGASIIIHGLVEYSYAYAYFLIPLAIFLGLASQKSNLRQVKVPKKWITAIASINICTGIAIIYDYARIEEGFVEARFSQSEFGKHLPQTTTPNLLILNQIETYHQAIAFKDWKNIDATQVEIFKKVYRRYGSPPAIYAYAKAKKIQDPYFQEGEYLKKICLINSSETCVIYTKKIEEIEKYFDTK